MHMLYTYIYIHTYQGLGKTVMSCPTTIEIIGNTVHVTKNIIIMMDCKELSILSMLVVIIL